jgi:DNA-binding beta-propeller fold protein YncE
LAAGSEGSLAIDGQIWVANATDGSISLIDPRSASVVKHIDAVCEFPIAFSAEQENAVWLACFASAELVAIDRESFAIGQRIKLRDAPLNLVTHPSRRLAYVSLPRQNAVAEIDLESGDELRRMRVGIEPDSLRWGN